MVTVDGESNQLPNVNLVSILPKTPGQRLKILLIKPGRKH